MVFKFGQMERNTKVIGEIIKLMEMESFGILMEIYFKGNGSTIKQMDGVYIYMQMVQNMKEIGKMMYRMDMENKLG